MKKTSCLIEKHINKYPRAGLLKFPAIIHKMPAISSLTGYEVYTMRDDLTGFALGGNKTRKLDYLVADARLKNADTLITMKATSFSRNAAAAGKTCGMKVYVVVPGSEADHNPVSREFFRQYDADVKYAETVGETALTETYNRVLHSLRQNQRSVYELHPGGSDKTGALGYVYAFQQILEFSENTGIYFTDIIHSAGSNGTQAGLLAGKSISDSDVRIAGIGVSVSSEIQTGRVHELCLSINQMLETDRPVPEIIVDDSYIGPGYAIASAEGEKAVKLFADSEGILFDQVYTGKAAAALLDYAKKGKFAGKFVLFLHTGGNAGLFY